MYWKIIANMVDAEQTYLGLHCLLKPFCASPLMITVKILKFGTPQTIATIVLKIEKFDVTLH